MYNGVSQMTKFTKVLYSTSYRLKSKQYHNINSCAMIGWFNYSIPF